MFRQNKVLAICGVVACAFAMAVDAAYAQYGHKQLFGFYAISLLLFLIAVKWSDKNRYVGWAITVTAIAIALLLTSQPNTVVSPILLVLWVCFFPLLLPEKRAWRALVITNIAFISTVLLFKTSLASALNSLSFVGFQVFSMVMMLTLIKENKKKVTLEKLNLELLMTQNLLKEKSQVEERMRISQNLHDSIGQKLTAITLSLEYAKYKTPDNLSVYFEKVKNDVSETLNDLRAIVSDSKKKGQVDISAVIARLCDGIEMLTFQSQEPIVLNDHELSEHIIYCLKEGISNALRHGKADIIKLNVHHSESTLVISLVDNGHFQTSEPSDEFGGNGLKGMQERLSSFSGSVDIKKNALGGATLQLQINNKYRVTEI